MPNSCNSITKIILICSLTFLTSCSLISQTSSEKIFVGKFNFNQNNASSNFTVRIKVFPENVIIQIGKPLFGNLMKIKFNYSMGLTFDPNIDNKYLDLFRNLNKQDYLYLFDSCFYNLTVNQNIYILNKEGIEIKCEYKNKNTFSFYFRSGEELYIYGALMHE